MAIEDIEWRERYGDQSYKVRSLSSIRAAIFAFVFSQTVILPSLPAFLSALHARPAMLGYCLSAQCLGELCSTPLFSYWYDKRNAREVVGVALLLNAFGSLTYSAAPHRLAVLVCRFVVGVSFGVREMLMTLVGGFTHQRNRSEVLASIRSIQVCGLVLGLGFAAVATFWHMPAPKPLGGLQYRIPSYVKTLENQTNAVVNKSLGGSSQEIEAANSFFGRLEKLVTTIPDSDDQNEVESVEDVIGIFGVENASKQEQSSEVPGGTLESDVKTDEEIGDQIGQKGLYIPSYVTALVGRGLKAPGYLSCIVSVVTAIHVWQNLEEGPRKILTERVPLVHLSPQSLSYFTPLVACLALEGLSQFCFVSFECLIAPVLRFRGNWLVDATAVSMLFIVASGVFGWAVIEELKRVYPLRHLMGACVGLIILGSVYCLPWRQFPAIFEFILGCSISAAGFFPLSAISTQIFSMGIVKIYSDQGEMVWLQLFWNITSIPARVVGPVILALLLERDMSGMTCYLIIIAITVVSLLVLLYWQTALLTPQLEESIEVLPASGILLERVPTNADEFTSPRRV